MVTVQLCAPAHKSTSRVAPEPGDLAEYLDRLAESIRSQGTEASALAASRIQDLATEARHLVARTAEEFEAHDELMREWSAERVADWAADHDQDADEFF